MAFLLFPHFLQDRYLEGQPKHIHVWLSAKRKGHTKWGLHHLCPGSQPLSHVVTEVENATPGYDCTLIAWAEPQSTYEELDVVHLRWRTRFRVFFNYSKEICWHFWLFMRPQQPKVSQENILHVRSILFCPVAFWWSRLLAYWCKVAYF